MCRAWGAIVKTLVHIDCVKGNYSLFGTICRAILKLFYWSHLNSVIVSFSFFLSEVYVNS